MKTQLLYLLTRTPLHVGAGDTAGAVDQPVLRERPTGFPVIPGAALKGAFADMWTDPASGQRRPEGAWLFGLGSPGDAAAGALQFSEARLLAFPVRSAKGNFAWLTCPLMLRRLARDRGLPAGLLPAREWRDDQALFGRTSVISLAYGQEAKVVLEDYTFSHAGELPAGDAMATRSADARSGASAEGAASLTACFQALISRDPVWGEIGQRLVMVSDGMMSFFCQSACEIQQRVAVNDVRGAAEAGDFFTQENVPSETLFYASLNGFEERTRLRPKEQKLEALQVFADRVMGRVVQLGGDASIGHGLCTVEIRETLPEAGRNL